MNQNRVATLFSNLKKRVTCGRHIRRVMDSRSMGDGYLWTLNVVAPSEAGYQGASEEALAVHAKVAGMRMSRPLEERMLTGAVHTAAGAGNELGATEIEAVTEIGIGTGGANEKATENAIAIETSEPRTGSVQENRI